MTILSLDGVSKTFGEKKILDQVSYSFTDHQIYRIVGENGTGKSTLMRIMMGLVLPDQGTVTLNGIDAKKFSTRYRKQMNFAFASDRTLYYKLTAYENLYYIGRIYGIPRRELREEIPRLLEKVGLQDNKDFIEKYSTGMKKKLMIAKSFINHPKIIFYDEVFSGLDVESCEMILDWISSVEKTTFIIISHQENVKFKGEKVLKLEEGKLREE